MSVRLILMVVAFVPAVSNAVLVTTWQRSALGSGLDGHYIHNSVNNRKLSSTYLRLGREGSGSASYAGTSYGYKNIAVEPQRRYRIELTGRRNEWGGVSAGYWYATAYAGGSKVAQTETRNAKDWNTRSDDFSTSASTTQVQFRFNSYLNFYDGTVSRWHEMRDAKLYKIIYAPQLAIGETNIRVNSDEPGGNTATVSLTAENTNNWLDRPNLCTLDWGDGTSVADPTLNASHVHQYSISAGSSQVWMACLQGSNEGGSSSATAAVEVLRRPGVALSVNGVSVVTGQKVVVDISENPFLDMSLTDSVGFIENTSFFIPDKLDVSGTDLTYVGFPLTSDDIGSTLPLTVSVSNTGDGVNQDMMTVDLVIVPEPATFSILFFGAVVLFWRRMRFVMGTVMGIAYLATAVEANVYHMNSGLTSLEFVPVCDAGNAADDTGYGSVEYDYRIGKYEVTNGQYCEFLNSVAAIGDPHGLYDTRMGGGWNDIGGIARTGTGTVADPWIYAVRQDRGNRPINFVSFWDACRFANWLHNGQPSGSQNASTTEDGSYSLNNVTNPVNAEIIRNPGATVVIPNENEWYKAAYYKGEGSNSGYWEYATQSDSPPTGEPPRGTTSTNGSANYWVGGYVVGPPYYTTEVGAYLTSASAYGTFDQNGNVWEWSETIADDVYRVTRGGSKGSLWDRLRASHRHPSPPVFENYARRYGFRVADVSPVPEPATLILLAFGCMALLRRQRQIR
ncbi:MAG: SUMF1/EgtB/PvdO family nonheme iron enzyme [Phycisphaerae bacterium]|nr:SUMF1/EgtB/PvdO family nonheme iron enzyme [Phycisphaerae bacterium]